MNEKILINSNSIAAQTAIESANEAAKVINERLEPALKTIGIPFTMDVLKDCFSGATKTEKNYFDALEKDLKTIKTPSISNSLEATATEAWEKFESTLTEVRREAGNHHQRLTIIEGEAVLSPDGEEIILEAHRIYLTDASEKTAYLLHCEVVEKLNQLFNNKAPYQWQTIFAIDASGKIYRNESTNYEIIVSNGR